MKKNILTGISLGIVAILGFLVVKNYVSANVATPDVLQAKPVKLKKELQQGDIIFQTSTSSQSKAIQLATKSKYSHMGIIYENEGNFYVYEAIQPVKLTPLQNWIARGEDGHYVVKRLKNAKHILTPNVIAQMKAYGKKFKGKSYDSYFEWTDDKIYCSELVWKIYKEVAHVEIGSLEQLADFDLSHPLVQQKLKERYGNAIPMHERVISPAQMFNSEQLIPIIEH